MWISCFLFFLTVLWKAFARHPSIALTLTCVREASAAPAASFKRLVCRNEECSCSRVVGSSAVGDLLEAGVRDNVVGARLKT